VGTFISLLRGINVASQNLIRMPELKRLYETLGFGEVVTYVQSGNVVFGAPDGIEAELEKSIEAEIQRSLGLSVTVLVRTPDEIERVIQRNPFTHGRNEDATRLYVTFLSSAPNGTELTALQSPNEDGDEFVLDGREIYLFCPNHYGRTRLNNNLFERKLKIPATTRNWNTVNTLFKMATER
jgi:uncharacterized protein (DUF1697 family)